MSWIDLITQDLTITTGDGKKYIPNWLNAQKGFEFQLAEFEFVGIAGALIKRGLPKARRFPMELYFQGDNHLDIASAFEKSSFDTRVWTLSHPFYGNIIVHPTGLNFDNSEYNITKINCNFIETITQDAPKTVIDPVDNITIDKSNLDDTFINSFTVTPSSADINTLTANNAAQYKKGVGIIKIPSEAENFFNLFNNANSAVNNATASPLLAMRATQSLINAPALFTSSVQNRVALLGNNFTTLRSNIASITNPSSKKVYETSGGANISAQALASAMPQDGDYSTSNDVLSIIGFVLGNYNQYLVDLDSLQTANGGSTDSYIPDADSLTALSLLMNQTISSLFDIALSSKSERTLILEQDSNWILLTHRLYSLDPFDNNLVLLMQQNNVGLNEILQVKKGRTVTYYI